MAKPIGMKPEIVKWIRDLYAKGKYTQQQLANTFGVSQSTICKIINNDIHRRSGLKLTGQADTKVGYKHGH